MPAILANEFKYQKQVAGVNLATNTLKCVLMAAGFAFDRDAHANWSDVSASALPTANGHSPATLAGKAVTKDNDNDRSRFTCTDVTWTASGGNIGPSPGEMIYKDSGVAGTSTLIGYLEFAQALTAYDSNPFTIASIVIDDT